MAKGKYREWLKSDRLSLLRGWALQGLSDEQIAHNMGIHVSTLYLWKNEHSEIFEALKNGKEIADLAVENALYKQASGYDYEETITEMWVDANGNEKGKHIRKLKKHARPDTLAQIYWLKNRQPDRWKDRREATNEDDVKKLKDALDEVKSAID